MCLLALPPAGCCTGDGVTLVGGDDPISNRSRSNVKEFFIEEGGEGDCIIDAAPGDRIISAPGEGLR